MRTSWHPACRSEHATTLWWSSRSCSHMSKTFFETPAGFVGPAPRLVQVLRPRSPRSHFTSGTLRARSSVSTLQIFGGPRSPFIFPAALRRARRIQEPRSWLEPCCSVPDSHPVCPDPRIQPSQCSTSSPPNGQGQYPAHGTAVSDPSLSRRRASAEARYIHTARTRLLNRSAQLRVP